MSSCHPLILSSYHPIILSSSHPLILSSCHPENGKEQEDRKTERLEDRETERQEDRKTGRQEEQEDRKIERLEDRRSRKTGGAGRHSPPPRAPRARPPAAVVPQRLFSPLDCESLSISAELHLEVMELQNQLVSIQSVSCSLSLA
ncbi:unnamed protein product [Pleuronectes platessa]|uniref:Uncharacterized protein n=1 Tax=Pleuronectes platessa TaxID=8262 RepID=A0A9N7YF35_PLEPL|nr:unnamed protein product [Pleuronectes platessa]